MARKPVDDAEIEIICPRCGHRMTRTASRLRRGTPVVCIQCGEEIPLDPQDGGN
jgi:DNA-directed RNA polymerase subunit RPC12/RpoP